MHNKLFLVFMILLTAGGILQGCGNTSAQTVPSDLIHTEKSFPVNFYSSSEQGILVYKVTNQADFDTLWEHFRLTDNSAEIDWNQQSAIFLGIIESSSCPLQYKLAKLNEEKTEVSLYLEVNSEDGCTDDATPRTMVIAMDAVEMNNVKVVKVEDYFGLNPVVEFQKIKDSNEEI
ncbi:hypothetical protein J27TS8_17580 [Robertmurraya siralis]|uniref:Lipoprotein n=1 Tax=Robertmurraya siralis TaxID=77777 RepID=A0A919WH07_9BACI|nr:hypothetical protein [Robertmurraya siralis]PAE21593.1 hypothetical protein CHH80_06770 [Bacillus sp. 7504-2]GIN61765.1 hypothetical protein J27TS8_17580 [Robertmurraya siralis]